MVYSVPLRLYTLAPGSGKRLAKSWSLKALLMNILSFISIDVRVQHFSASFAVLQFCMHV